MSSSSSSSSTFISISDLTLPKDVVNYLAANFLTDLEVISLACCCRSGVRTFSHYRIKSVLPFGTAIWFSRNHPPASENDPFNGAPTPDQPSVSFSSSIPISSSISMNGSPPSYLFPISSEPVRWFRVGRSDVSSILLQQQDLDALYALDTSSSKSISAASHSPTTLSTLFPPVVGNINPDSISENLPTSSIRHITLGNDCDADAFSLSDRPFLPEGLLTFNIGHEYSGELCRIALPFSLQRLELASKSPIFLETESTWKIPQGLKHLSVTTDILDILCSDSDGEGADHEEQPQRGQLEDDDAGGEEEHEKIGMHRMSISDLFHPKQFLQRDFESLVFKGPPTEIAPEITFPPSLTSLSWSFRNLPELKTLPGSLRNLSLDVKLPGTTTVRRRSSPLTISYLPPQLHTLHLSGEILFVPPSDDASEFFPQSLRKLSISNCNVRLNQIPLPSHLQTFELRICQISFNKLVLPPSLTSFVYAGPMNRNTPLNMIWGGDQTTKSQIRHLDLSSFNDQLISELSLPPSLTSLILPGFAADMFLQGGGGAANAFDCSGLVLPETLEELTFGYWFNSNISGIHFPSSLRSIKFHSPLFHQNISSVKWPQSLQTLELAGHYQQNFQQWIPPPDLTRLVLSGEFNCEIPSSMIFPASLQHVTFAKGFTRPLGEWNVPLSLKSLEFERIGAWNLPPTSHHLKLNPSLEKLMFCYHFNQALVGHNFPPASLRELHFYGMFNQSLAPLANLECLEKLVINSDFNQPLSGPAWQLPASLRTLELGSYWNLSFQQQQEEQEAGISMILPSNLVELVFGTEFDQDLTGLVGQVPKLRKLVLGREFKHTLLPLTGLKELQRLQLFAERSFPFPKLARDETGTEESWRWPPALQHVILQLQKWKAETDPFCASQIPHHVRVFEINREETDNFASPYQFLLESLTGKLHSNCKVVGFESKRF